MREKMSKDQQVWWAEREPRRQNLNGYVTVTGVGRKWVYLSNGERIDSLTWHADARGYASNGRVWLSEADWRAQCERQQAWRALRKAVDQLWHAPAGLSTDEIEQMTEKVSGRAALQKDTTHV